jgi:hypothetical protein
MSLAIAVDASNATIATIPIIIYVLFMTAKLKQYSIAIATKHQVFH